MNLTYIGTVVEISMLQPNHFRTATWRKNSEAAEDQHAGFFLRSTTRREKSSDGATPGLKRIALSIHEAGADRRGYTRIETGIPALSRTLANAWFGISLRWVR